MTPTKKRPMPPPGKKPALTVAIGVGKPPDGGGPDAPPDSGMPKAPGSDGGEKGEGKAPPERAIVIRADQQCKDCENYTPESGECSEVEGFFDPSDACWCYFEPLSGESPGDTDDKGALPPGAPPMGGMPPGAMGQ
jgi:hypothetical protein